MDFDINAMRKNNTESLPKEYQKIIKGLIVDKNFIEEIKNNEAYKFLIKSTTNLEENQHIAIAAGLIGYTNREEAQQFLGHVLFYITILNKLNEEEQNGKTKKSN